MPDTYPPDPDSLPGHHEVRERLLAHVPFWIGGTAYTVKTKCPRAFRLGHINARALLPGDNLVYAGCTTHIPTGQIMRHFIDEEGNQLRIVDIRPSSQCGAIHSFDSTAYMRRINKMVEQAMKCQDEYKEGIRAHHAALPPSSTSERP
jgi:hypothetical protein